MRFRRRLSSILTILGSAESFEDQVCDVVVSGIESVLHGTPTNPHQEVRPNNLCATRAGGNMVLSYSTETLNVLAEFINNSSPKHICRKREYSPLEVVTNSGHWSECSRPDPRVHFTPLAGLHQGERGVYIVEQAFFPPGREGVVNCTKNSFTKIWWG